MKDYTKYDFTTIIGAEVELNVGDNCPICHGIVLSVRKYHYQDTPSVILKLINNFFNYREGDIIPIGQTEIHNIITAKIKGYDMNIKQMDKCAITQVIEKAEKAGYEVCDTCLGSVTLYRNMKAIMMKVYFLDKKKEYLKGHTNEYDQFYADINLGDSYSCTEWGWKE